MPSFPIDLAANHGIMTANFAKMAANLVLSYAREMCFHPHLRFLSYVAERFFTRRRIVLPLEQVAYRYAAKDMRQ